MQYLLGLLFDAVTYVGKAIDAGLDALLGDDD